MPRGSQPGERRGGRSKGTPNKTTGLLKDAILLAGKEVGEDGEGRGGLRGYLRMVAKSDTKAFSTLLGRVLPTQVTGDGGSPISIAVIRFTDEAPKD